MVNFDKFDRQKNRQKRRLVEEEHRIDTQKNFKYIDEIDEEEELEDTYFLYSDEEENDNYSLYSEEDI